MEKVNKKGFSLLEMLAVIAIIAILAGVIIPLVAHYLKEGKEDYNEKLKQQLVLAGKEYYANNQQLLPTSVSEKTYSYATVPELQSQNYITKDFVDSEKRDCKKSFIYVKNSDVQGEHEWYPCLICGDKNYGDISQCEISDWETVKQPACNLNGAVYNGGTKSAEGTYINPATITFDLAPESIEEGAEGKIVVLKNGTSEKSEIKISDISTILNEPQQISTLIQKIPCPDAQKCNYSVKINSGAGDTQGYCGQFQIDNTIPSCGIQTPGYNPSTIVIKNIKNVENRNPQVKVKKTGQTTTTKPTITGNVTTGSSVSFGTTAYTTDGKYQVLIEYNDNNGSKKTTSCGEFTIDKTAPKCELAYNKTTNKLTLTSEKTATYKIGKSSTNIEKSGTFSTTDNVTITPGTDLKTYYGYVTDKAGNTNTCYKSVSKSVTPTCKFTKEISGWLNTGDVGKSQTVTAVCQYKAVDYVDINSKKLVDVYDKISNPTYTYQLQTGTTYKTLTFTINFKPLNEKGGDEGLEYVRLQKGFITLTNDSTKQNAQVQSKVNVDTIKPTIYYTPESTYHSAGWYESPFVIKRYCYDKTSGVKKFVAGDTTKNYTSYPTTSDVLKTTRTSSARPVAFTASCLDRAGNSSSKSKDYYIRVYGRDSSCGCSEWNRVKDYCKLRNRCSSCTCQTYQYYWGSWVQASKYTGDNKTTGCPSSQAGRCNSGTYGKKQITNKESLCKKWGANGRYCLNLGCRWQYRVCKRKCNTYNRCASCSCAEWAYKNGTCKTYKKCWHY